MEEKPELMIKNIVLEKYDVDVIKQFAKEKGLGSHGFSAALRQIVRDWEKLSSRKTRRSNSGGDVTED